MRAKDLVLTLFGMKAFQPEQGVWEEQYQNNQWQHLHQIGELAHYNVIRGYIRFFKPGADILDIGCGEGVLNREMSRSDYHYYQGIDFSDTAIHNANASLQNEKTFFKQADAHAYQPDRQYDCIVFCESLNCINNPDQLISRLRQYLKPDGIIIISLYRQLWVDRLTWRKVQQGLTLIDQTLVQNGSGQAWTCKVFKPE
ncbi:class I SAM-dependent methyltransferase [Photobacterium sp. MCCC 1A19761]|uniref:class I SAM-dependent methyltransferase n=1 Tax=Photobacterium sp. MCCC 1A19761 TaxID=3115000 RepID=UPI00307F6581